MSYARRDAFNPVRSCTRCGKHFELGEVIYELVAGPGDLDDDGPIKGVVLCFDCTKIYVTEKI